MNTIAAAMRDILVQAVSWLLLLAVAVQAGCESRTEGVVSGDIQSLLDGAVRRSATSLVIPPGTYHLVRPTPDANFYLKIAHASHLDVIADGVTCIVDDPRTPSLILECCDHVSVQGITFVRPGMIHGQGTIVGVGSSWVDVRPSRGYPQAIDDRQSFPCIPVINIFLPTGRTWKAGVPDLYTTSVERSGEGTFRFHLAEAGAGERYPVAVGDRAAWRGVGGEGHDVVQFWTEACRLTHITIRNAAGMAFMELAGNGGNIYDHCVVTYGNRPNDADEDPLLASSVDGLHSLDMRRGPQVTGCSFEGLDDDGIAIHGTYGRIVAIGAKRVVIDTRPVICGPKASVFCGIGDHLRILDERHAIAQTVEVIGTRVVSGYVPAALPETDSRRFKTANGAVYVEVSLAEDVLAPARPGCFVENEDQIGNGFRISGCSIRSKRGHGLLIKAGSGVIEENTIEENLMGAIVVAPEIGSWSESGYAQDLVIRRNTLRRCGLGTQVWNGIVTVAAFEGDRFVPLPGGHRRIRIEGNVFSENDGNQIVISSASDVAVSGNAFIDVMRNPERISSPNGPDRGALVWVVAATGVRCVGNTITRPGPSMLAPVRCDGDGGSALIDGFTVVREKR